MIVLLRKKTFYMIYKYNILPCYYQLLSMHSGQFKTIFLRAPYFFFGKIFILKIIYVILILTL